MLECYHSGLTTCSKKVRLCLAEKGLEYKSHFVNLKNFEHHTPEYLALNPNGVVPTLVHDGKVIIESSVINEYLDEVFPEPPLKPAEPERRALMRVWSKMADEYGLNAVRISTWTRTKTEDVKALTEKKEIDKVIGRIPLKDHRDKYRAISEGGFSQKDFEDAEAKMDFVMERAEKDLAVGPWITGATYSLGDIAIIPYIDQFSKVRPDLIDPEGKYPRVAEWHARMMARPAVIKTFTPSAETSPPATAAA